MGGRGKAGVGPALPTQIPPLGRRRQDLEGNDDVTNVALPPIDGAMIGGNNQDVGLRPIGLGHANAQLRQHHPRRLEFAFPDRERNDDVPDDQLMHLAWRGVQDRLPVDQLPFLLIGPRVRECVEFTVIGAVSMTGTPTMSALLNFQLFTRTGPPPWGRSPSLRMPRRFATSV